MLFPFELRLSLGYSCSEISILKIARNILFSPTSHIFNASSHDLAPGIVQSEL